MAFVADGEDLRGLLLELARRHGLVAIYAFGSRAAEVAARVRGESTPAEHPASDVDVGVQSVRGQRLSAQEKASLALALEDLLEVRQVDLVPVDEAPPFLALDVIRGELIACTDPDEQAEYELYVLRRAGDLAPFERARRDLILRHGGR